MVFQYQDNSRSFVVLQANNQENIYIVDWNLLEYRYVHNHLVDCWNQYCKQHLMFLERQTWSRLRIGFELKLSKLNEPAFGYNNNFLVILMNPGNKIQNAERTSIFWKPNPDTKVVRILFPEISLCDCRKIFC